MDDFEIGQRTIVEYQPHTRSGTEPLDSLARFRMRNQLAVRIGPPAPNFGKLVIGQAQITHVLDVIKQGTRSSVLLVGRQLLDLA